MVGRESGPSADRERYVPGRAGRSPECITSGGFQVGTAGDFAAVGGVNGPLHQMVRIHTRDVLYFGNSQLLLLFGFCFRFSERFEIKRRNPHLRSIPVGRKGASQRALMFADAITACAFVRISLFDCIRKDDRRRLPAVVYFVPSVSERGSSGAGVQPRAPGLGTGRIVRRKAAYP